MGKEQRISDPGNTPDAGFGDPGTASSPDARRETGPKRSFQLLVGTHYEGDRTYREGQVVESSRPLDTLFVNKFKALDVDPSDRPPRKIVMDGARSGASSAPVDESTTTRSAGGHQAWDDEPQAAAPGQEEQSPNEFNPAENAGPTENEQGTKLPKAVRGGGRNR